MTRFEQVIVAIISVSVVCGFVISNQSEHAQTHSESSESQAAAAQPATVKTAPQDAGIAKTAKKPAYIAPSKKQFYQSLLPFIERENNAITALRSDLKKIHTQLGAGNQVSDQQSALLLTLSKTYRVKPNKTPASQTVNSDQITVEKLLVKIDHIPASLVLSQSANESAWGRSRFATEANNYFGIWCFKPGCGVVPSGRPAKATYEVTRYQSVSHSVTAYFRNINSHPAYSQLREIRAELRHKDEPITGAALAGGLEHYSARGDAYIEELRAMIRYNKLEGITLQSL
ncbi:MAG: glucosaminidase domain-containing protein [Pseudomonadales bacterium]|nr:glucosaminidase domain-containing protein [Pseudomonadales bacterium]